MNTRCLYYSEKFFRLQCCRDIKKFHGEKFEFESRSKLVFHEGLTLSGSDPAISRGGWFLCALCVFCSVCNTYSDAIFPAY